MPDFDVNVIGSGPAGEVLAGRTAAGGLSTAIVEDRLVGGECGFYACMPLATVPPAVPRARQMQQRQGAECAAIDDPSTLASGPVASEFGPSLRTLAPGRRAEALRGSPNHT